MIDIKVRLILRKGHRVLLSLQRTAKGGKYTLVGGRIESMEYAKEALMRECLEELGIQLKKKDLQLVHVLHKKNSKGNVITLYFTCSDWKGTLYNMEPKNFLRVEWHPIHQLPAKTSPTCKQVITKYLNGKLYSELNRVSPASSVKLPKRDKVNNLTN